jgi:O-antigen ligase
MANGAAADGGNPPSIAWRLPSRLAMAAAPLALSLLLLVANIVWPIKAIVAITLAVTLAAPASGLLMVALTAPLGQLIAPAIGYSDFRIGEAIVIAFLAGWLLRGLQDRPGPRLPAAIAGGLFSAAVLASIAGLAWQLRAYPAAFSGAIDRLTHIYFFVVDPIGVVDGARLLEGIGLGAATIMLFRRRPSLAMTLPAALAASAAIGALSSVLLWRGIGTAEALARYRMIGYRISGHIGDVNAAGSYFAMMVCAALGMSVRERGFRRAIWLGLAAASGVGLWFSESRSALGAAGLVIALAATWAASSRFRPRSRVAVLGTVLVGLLAVALVRAQRLDTDPTYRGGGFRSQFVQTSLRMIRARPLFGVGEGQYYQASPLFLSPQLAWNYGAENAHNFFLQVGGELGVVGLGLFAIALGVALVRAGRALGHSPRDTRLLGMTGGVVAFLITSFTGHPFLISEVVYPFWMVCGLMSALAGSTLLDRAAEAGAPPLESPPAWPRRAVAAAAAILISSPVLAARSVLSPPESRAVDGLYGWETLEDGTRFRWTGEYASVFVPADVTRVEIPVRLPTDGRSIRPMGVEVNISGVSQGRTMVDARWAVLSLPLPAAVPPSRFKRIDLKVDRVWQPALYIAGNADMRLVGVQVSEPRLIRE